ncbi:MAG: aminotransferase class I/II-fold pyridoxal phosphate-dependent enzyme [Acidobacteriales bacterium]|nr:aminotransferase class I/II-fold pyridoxal phosphate-dependent enzyme [Terriglobales bacterium]
MQSTSSLSLAQRLETVGFSDIVQIRNKILALREGGQKVFEFHGGEPYFETPDPIKQAIAQAIAENKTHYAPSSGIAPLRQQLARKLSAKNGIEATADEVIVTTGGMQALYAAFQTTLNPGDRCIVFSPYWTPIGDLLHAAQAEPLLVDSERGRADGLRTALASALSPKVRAIYYNTPNNPSGFVFTREEAEIVAEFAIQNDLIVIADEAYEDLVYEGEHFSIASLPGMMERTITCYTFSKSYAMTGWRVGYAVAREPWMTGLRKIVLYSTNGVATPNQWAALHALSTPETELLARREEYRRRRDLLVSGLHSVGFGIQPPAGAFYAFPNCEHIQRDSRVAAQILLEKARVSSVPGTVFAKEGHLRMCFAASPETIAGAIDSIRRNL